MFFVAPPTKPRAALKLRVVFLEVMLQEGCTTHKAACGIETRAQIYNLNAVNVAPPTKPRAALKREMFLALVERVWLHHPQSRVRH